MTDLPAGTVKEPQRSNTLPPEIDEWISTETAFTTMSAAVGLSSRIAPASKQLGSVPHCVWPTTGPPRNVVLGEPCHGIGKLAGLGLLVSLSSAYPTDTERPPAVAASTRAGKISDPVTRAD